MQSEASAIILGCSKKESGVFLPWRKKWCNCKVDRSVHQTEKETSQATYLCNHNGVNCFIELHSYSDFTAHVNFMQFKI